MIVYLTAMIAFRVLFLFVGACFFTFSVNGQLVKTQAVQPFTAKWIAPPDVSLKTYGVYHFRKSFEVASMPDSFIVHVSADNRYHLFVNGKPVALGPQRSDVAHWHYETLNVRPYLKPGKNTLAAVVWNQGENMAWAQMSFQTGLWVQGQGEATVVNTNATWKVKENTAYKPVATTAHITGPFEQVFAQRYPWGWQEPSYNDTNWLPAIETETAVPAQNASNASRSLLPRNLPLPEKKAQRFRTIRRMEGLEKDERFINGAGSLEIHPWATVTILLDQGALTTAYPELLVSGGTGAKITATYAEALFSNKTGEKGNRNDIDGKSIRGDQDVFLPDGGEQRLFRPLWYRTFRYVELKIENHQAPLTIHDYRSEFTAYPFEENASFRSDDTTLQAIWNTGWRTSRLCAYETYMDCPYYEQLQYIGDTRIQALISLYVSGDDRLMKNAITQFAQSRIDDGLTQSRYPSSLKQVIPPFSLFWISMLHDFWRLRKDDAFVQQFFPQVKEIIAWHEQHLNNTGMLGKMPYWNFVDWPTEWPWKGKEELSGIPAGTLEGNSSILTLQYVYALNKAAELYSAFGRREEAAHYKTLAERLNKATYAACWDKSKAMLADTPEKKEFSQHANVMAVLAGAIPAPNQQALLQRIEKDTSLVQCTIYYRFYLNEAFKKAGLGNDYIRMLGPWRTMISLGLSTFAERPEPTRSDCHAWSASPNYDLLATVCGIEPAAPGFSSVRIAPQPGPLQWIEASMPHPNGEINVSLQTTNNVLSGTITLPLNISGEVVWRGKKQKLRPGEQTIRL